MIECTYFHTIPIVCSENTKDVYFKGYYIGYWNYDYILSIDIQNEQFKGVALEIPLENW